jgi:hypothetical protein
MKRYKMKMHFEYWKQLYAANLWQAVAVSDV